jgi:large subunit ribosomal protein L16
MRFIPKKQKFKKVQKGFRPRNVQVVKSLYFMKFGRIAVLSESMGSVTEKQLTSFLASLSKTIKKTGKIVFRIFPHVPVTRKPLEVRMGKGKGGVFTWIQKIKKGTIICEIESSNLKLAYSAFLVARHRLPFKTSLLNYFI